jgi:hypothetical protein
MPSHQTCSTKTYLSAYASICSSAWWRPDEIERAPVTGRRHRTHRFCKSFFMVSLVALAPIDMKDLRLEKLARLRTEYSLALKPRQTSCISANATASPLLRKCYSAVLRCRACPFTRVAVDGSDKDFFRFGNEDQLKWVSPLTKFECRRLTPTRRASKPLRTVHHSHRFPKRFANWPAKNRAKSISRSTTDRPHTTSSFLKSAPRIGEGLTPSQFSRIVA